MDTYIVSYEWFDVIDAPEVHPEDPLNAFTSTIYVLGVEGHDCNCDCDYPTESDPSLTPTQLHTKFVIGLFDTANNAKAYAYTLLEDEEFLNMTKKYKGRIIIEKAEYNMRLSAQEIMKLIQG